MSNAHNAYLSLDHILIIGGIVYLVMLPKRRRDAAITCREYPVKKRLTYCLLPVRMLSRTGLNGLISSGRDVPRATRAASSPA